MDFPEGPVASLEEAMGQTEDLVEVDLAEVDQGVTHLEEETTPMTMEMPMGNGAQVPESITWAATAGRRRSGC